jgi:hypothetical protein
MKTGWKILLVVIFIVFPLSLIILACFKWTDVKENFFSFSIKDIITLVSTGYIGIVVMVVFSTISNNSRKRLEIISENITMFQTYLENVLTVFSNSQNTLINENSKGHILRSLRIAANEFTNINEFLKVEKNDKETIMLLEIVKENLITFKQVITDKPSIKNYKVSEKDIQNATETHNKIRHNTQKIKMNLYK